MAYKDKDKQREADRERQRRYRAERGRQAYPKGVTQGVTDSGRDKQGVTVIPSESHVGASDIGAVKTLHRLIKALPIEPELTAQGNIRVSKPGDADYVPQCETTRAFIEGRAKRLEAGKRGKAIKCFDDLPVDVKLIINRLSDSKEEKQRRTAIAINYQHQFPDRYHSTGVV